MDPLGKMKNLKKKEIKYNKKQMMKINSIQTLILK
jgi:hypothetical protein